MRVMSFSLTTEQMRNKTKTVTRRLGWKDLQPGTLLHAVERARGLKRHERVSLGIIRVVSVRRERLCNITPMDVVNEGFGDLARDTHVQWPFIEMFCAGHGGCDYDVEVTRIAFEFAEPQKEFNGLTDCGGYYCNERVGHIDCKL